MMNEAIEFALDGILAVWHWFVSITDSIPGSLSFVIAMLEVYLSYRFLLLPLLAGRGISGSDRVRKYKKTRDPE